MYSITIQGDDETEDNQKNYGQTEVILGSKSAQLMMMMMIKSISCMNLLEQQKSN
jgi:hypothetical protein